jgi:hypothetical protein
MDKEKLFIIAIAVSLLFNVFLVTLVVSDVSSTITGQAITDLEEKNFDVYTEAVCEEDGQNIVCHDEVFVECLDVKTKLGNIVGDSTYFELDWVDPRE